MLETIYYKITGFFTFLIKLYHYGKLLWRDEDWDWSYALILLQYKLKRMRKCFSDCPFINSKKHCKQLRTAELLIERITKDEYASKEYDEISNIYGSILDRKLNGEMDKEYYRKVKWAVTKSEIQLKQDLKLLFKILDKHLITWWY